MDQIEALKKDHARLRRLAEEVEAALGPKGGEGWDDCVYCDLNKLRASQEKLSQELALHEAQEEFVMAGAVRRRLSDEIEKAHKTLERLLSLLRTVSVLCDGHHVHAVRTTAGRVREELEEHLSYEEKSLFPALHGAGKAALKTP